MLTIQKEIQKEKAFLKMKRPSVKLNHFKQPNILVTRGSKERVKRKKMEKDIPCLYQEKKTRLTILISAKVNFRAKNISRDKEVYFIMMKGSSHQKGLTALNIYALNNKASKNCQNYKEKSTNPQL